jgi:hypothetical protein
VNVGLEAVGREAMAENRSIIRVDRVETQQYVEGPARLWKLLVNPDAGDLFLTSDGIIGFQSIYDKDPKWYVSVAAVTDVDPTVKSFGTLYKGNVVSGRAGKMMRATFDGTRRTVQFTGIVPKGSAGILGHVPFHIGFAVRLAKIAYDQLKVVPEEGGVSRSPGERARQACTWWVDLLRKGPSFGL